MTSTNVLIHIDRFTLPSKELELTVDVKIILIKDKYFVGCIYIEKTTSKTCFDSHRLIHIAIRRIRAYSRCENLI